MFEGILDDISILRAPLEAITELIDEAVLKIRDNGLEISASDRAVVAVVDFSLSSKAFKEYILKQNLDLGLNLVNLLHILKRAKPGDTLVIKSTGDKIDILLKGDVPRRFVMPVINISAEDMPDISKLEFKTNLKMKSQQLHDSINDADLIADSLIFDVDKDKVKITSQSDSSSTETVIDANQISMDVKEPARSRYSLEYLKKMIKASKISDTVKISLATDYPLKLIFENPHARVRFILAPRIEEV